MKRSSFLPLKHFTHSYAALLILAVLCLLPSGCATRGALPTTPSLFQQPMVYTVRPGDTLWSISKRFGVSVPQIMNENAIIDPRTLDAGQRIQIPGKGGARVRKKTDQITKQGNWKYIVIHHSATYEGNADIFDKQHRARGFWNGLGYHFVICNGTSGTRDGQIQVGDRWIKQIQGAHCNVGDMNEVGIGICLVGDFENGQDVTSRQFESLKRLVRSLQESYNIPSSNVVRHKDVKHSTECPGRHFPWQEFKSVILAMPSHLAMPSPLFAEQNTSHSSLKSASRSNLSSFYT